MATTRFFLGDDNGQLKSARCFQTPENEWKTEVTLLDNAGPVGKVKGIQRLAVRAIEQVAIVRADGSGSLFKCPAEGDLCELVTEWKESRFKPESKYIGLAIAANSDVISCTNSGHLRMIRSQVDGEMSRPSLTTAIPGRLCEWVLSDDDLSFAYGGDEVEVSVWDAERAFDSTRNPHPPNTTGSKRKKTELIDGEVWRAKNIGNDNLNLRHPVHNTSLTYLWGSGSRGPGHHILAGSRLGSVRRYDIRAARKPVADWKDIAHVGGVKKVQRGNSEHEAFVSDHGSNLSAVDVRTGRILYTYSGLAGAISSIAPTSPSLSPPLLGSTSLDRFFCLHSTPSLERGQILIKEWVKSAAQCVAWDGRIPVSQTVDSDEAKESDSEDDVWKGMVNVRDKGEHSDEDSSDNNVEDGKPETKRRKAR